MNIIFLKRISPRINWSIPWLNSFGCIFVFLLDFFKTNPTSIKEWRSADTSAKQRQFAPFEIRKFLDERDGFTNKKRAEAYKMFSELAGHPTMKSVYMMQPVKGGDAVIGPFIESTALEAVISEMGRLAIQAGDIINLLFPQTDIFVDERVVFIETKGRWIAKFYPNAAMSGK